VPVGRARGVNLPLPAETARRTVAGAVDPLCTREAALWVSAAACAVAAHRDGANHKRVWRVYREEGLAVKRRKRKRLIHVGRPLEAVAKANEEWAVDFASDTLATGRSLRVLSVVDAFTRECVALEADTSFASRRVTRVLEQAMEERGWPGRIRCDNGLNSVDDPSGRSEHYLRGRKRLNGRCERDRSTGKSLFKG